jgi:4-amino-4-deoxy-L-arabinose transferase-like glycosyltransferase
MQLQSNEKGCARAMAVFSNKKKLTMILWSIVTVVLLATFVYLCFGNLSAFRIDDYDEARHGINAYEMIRNDDYLVHTFQGEADLWNTKPPMSFWLITIAYKIFGYNAFALRFFSALSAVLVAVFVSLWSMKHYGKWAVPLILLIFTANSILFGLHFVRFGDADSQYQLFFTLAMLCLLQSYKKFPWLYGCGIFFSLAFLEKSLHSFVIPLTCLLSLAFTGRLKELTWKRVGLLLASALTIVLIWVIARISRDGLAFFTNSYELDVAGRVGGGIAEPEYADQNVFIYNFLAVFGKPTTLACLIVSIACALIMFIRKIKLAPFSKHAVIATLMWLFVPILFYSLLNVKFRWYVYSGLYALPVLTCILLVTVIRSGVLKKALRIGASIFAAGLIAMGVINVVNVSNLTFDQTVQAFIIDSLDRDLDSGKHAYILYAENGYSDWMPGAMLTALMYGDLVCIDGGLESFYEDDENSLLFVARTNNEELIEQLMGEEIIFNENYYCVAFEKF